MGLYLGGVGVGHHESCTRGLDGCKEPRLVSELFFLKKIWRNPVLLVTNEDLIHSVVWKNSPAYRRASNFRKHAPQIISLVSLTVQLRQFCSVGPTSTV